MAVYTQVSAGQLAAVLKNYNLRLEGRPRPVADGIENTTYFFHARGDNGQTQDYVLTLIESCPATQVDYTRALTQHLAATGLPVPAPLKSLNESQNCAISGRPALIFPKAKGHHLASPSAANCAAIGNFLARVHQSSASFPRQLDNTRGLSWLKSARTRLNAALRPDDTNRLETNLKTYQHLVDADLDSAKTLPRGAIHGDLFRDNALFENGKLTAVIDFYNACSDWFILDVAITLNDWCVNWPQGTYDNDKTQRFIKAYQQVRPFTPTETVHWQAALTIAANRFWISRLLDAHSGREVGETAKMKDPDEFLRLLGAIPSNAPTVSLGSSD